MTIITYSSSAGRLPDDIHVLEHLCASRSFLEPHSKILELWNIPEPWTNPILESCGRKGQSWTEQKGGREKGGARGEKLRGKSGKWGRRVSRERMERGGGKDHWSLRNECKWEFRKELKESGIRRMEVEKDGGCRSEADISLTRSHSERVDEIKQRCQDITEGHDGIKQEKKGVTKRTKWCDFFLWLPLLFLSLCPEPVSSQGNFPRLENIAAFKPVSTSPARSTCGVPDRSSYCQYPSTQNDLLGCSQAFCVQECPYRSSTPPYAPLLLPAHRGTCVTEDSNDTRPGTQTEPETRPSTDGVSTGSSSVVFWSVPEGCLVSPPSQNLGTLGSLTLALWIKASTPGEMVLLEKSSAGHLVFVVAVSEQAVTLRYGQSSSQPPLTISFRTEGRVALETWTHLVLQVHDSRVSLFLNGLEEDGTPFDTQPLTSMLHDIREDSAMWVGLSSNGSNQFIGRMQDFRFYPATLTNREIMEVYSGVLPHLHVQSECRCPPSHPRVHPLVERYCIPNAVGDTTNNRVLRLNLNAHPLSYINDQDMGTTWLSKTMAIQEDMDEGVTITVDLANGQYQVFYVIVQFGGLLPESVLIQRRSRNTTEPQSRTNTEVPWLDWQYMARDCSVFGLQNDGRLLEPDSVNCLQLPSEVPYSGGNITFSLLTPEPNLRPGYNNFYTTPALQRMVQATQVRIYLSGQYHTRAAGVNHRHRYYAINEITISGRCECHGHADHCDTSVTPYRCLCLPESHTEGHNCQRCAPLYNDKPFRSGDQLQPMSCRPCQCYGHAHSCHYDVQTDDQPDEHYRGGGGVCDSCMHNTAGKNCERCRSQFFRLEESSADVCQPCNCHTPGTVNGSMECDQVGGQCQCKAAVTGRQCAECLPGWYGLQTWHPKGCVRCNCSDIGVIRTSGGVDHRCDQDTGQCHCKPQVTGVYCDRCEFGYWNLSHPDGCVPCDCDPLGSLSPFCEPEGGQCECKAGVGGQSCDSCGRGSYGLRLEGSCAPCNCSKEGTIAGTECDPHTGQCVCKEHVEGRRCDSCRRGFHSLDHRNSLGCLPCVCDVTGTVPLGVCDVLTGQCPCQDGVEGTQCTHCAHNFYNRTSDIRAEGWSQGCVPCTCDPRGTVEGTMCDSTSGQCVCLPTWHEQGCSRCRPGFYLSEEESACVECDCHPIGASQRGCESQTGQCVCADPSVGGRRCDQCHEMYYGFNPGLGRCHPCACDPVGSVNGSCHQDSGVCVCKLLVTGDQCDVCQPGASHLDPENHLGCSKAPSQQPIPVGFALSFSSILLTWNPPDTANTNRLNYTLIRDGQSVHSIQSHYPFRSESFEDTDLSPYTNYSYWLIAASVAGQTESAPVTYQTLAAAPQADQLQLRLVGRPRPTSAIFNWTTPRNNTGPVERFVLSSIESSSGSEPVIHYRGLSTEAVASGLKPFTLYTLTLEACCSGGCTSTLPLSILTAPSPPQDQPPPSIKATGPHTLHATWEPPSQPNGVITRYEVFLRGPIELQNLTSPAPEKRVFLSSGWLDPSVFPEAQGTNGSIVPPHESSATITALQAFSTYQMRVVSINMAGSVTSEWTTARTMEGAPELMTPPEVSAVSSSSLKVTWSSAEGHGVIARGKVTEYRVNLLTEQSNNPYAPPVVSQVLHRVGPLSQPAYLVEGLKPYSVYNFTITLCTKRGCITSLPSTGRTLPAAPSGLSPPRLHPLNETTIDIDWDPPAQLNGPHPLYQVERTDASLSDSRDPVIRGTRFPGNSYYRFPSHTLPVNTDFTGVKLSFRTRSPDGLLLCAFSPGNQEEFLALQIQNGRPYFLFDPQGSAVAVGVDGDGGHRYNDGQWHSVMATRRGAVGTIVVNNRYRGNASASSGSTIIGENTGVFIGGLPGNFTLLREDTGDARLVRQGFSGCLRDVSFKMTDSPSEQWKPLDWSTDTESVAAYESWEGCPVQTEDGAHFLGQGYLELGSDVFSGGEDFDIAMDFRTDQLNALLLFTYNTHSEDFMLVELEGSLLSFVLFWGGHVTELSMWVGLSHCGGNWNQLLLAKHGSVISAAVNDWAEEIVGMGGAGRVTFDSPVYLGGVPNELIHPALASRSHKQGLGGCIKGVTIRSGETHTPLSLAVNLAAASRRSVRVYLDGCPTSDRLFHCRGHDSVLVYTGRETKARDYSLQPFTEYLYRFVALAAGGWVAGPWQRGRSQGTVPRDIPPPTTVQSGNGFSATVSWTPPIGDVRGVIDSYELRAYNRDQPDAIPVKAKYLANGNFTGVLSGLTPSTRYIVTVSACTASGCTESLYNDHGEEGDGRWSFTTQEEAPEAVSSPTGVSSPSALYVTWSPPARPNGHITEYLLYHNDRMVYRGNDRQLNITDLGVYSSHVLVLSVCTSAGCTNSSQVTMLTSQLPPGPLQPPILTLLDARTILVEWSRPSQVNGVLESYSLLLSREGAEPILAYNSSELFEDHTLRNLTPGTAYSVTLAACTGGGCTLSPSSQAQTEESTPENVSAPLVIPLSPHALNVSWTPPDMPNGVITSYGLWLDGTLVLNSSSSQRFLVVDGLSPWTRHILRLQACTAQGCGKGPVVEMRTLEKAPVGPVLLELTNQSSRSLRARWTAPPRPNGNLSYTLHYKSKDGDGVLDGRTVAGSWLSVTDLKPYTSYSFWIRGCNTQGCVESLPRNVTMLPAAPDGVSPPRLAHASSASLNVSWSGPAYANAPGPLRYTLHMRASPQRPVVSLLENAINAFSYSVEGLSPYTHYLFRVVVSHTHGQTASSWASLRTTEDSPGPVDTPTVSGLHPRSVTVTWVPPSQPNGLITNYTLYLRSSWSTSLTPNPSPLSSPSTHFNSGLGLSPSPMFGTSTNQDPDRNSGLDPRPTSNLTTPGSSHISMSTINTGSNGILNISQDTFPNFLPTPISSFRPGHSQGNQTGSNTVTNTSQGPSSISFHPTESNTISSASLGPSLLQSSPESYTSSSSSNINQDPTIHSPVYGSTSAGLDVISSPQSITVPGNTTSYTFLNLLPYQIYSLQVEACTSVGCSLSGTSLPFHTPPAAPEGVPAPHLYSDTPTSVLLSWGAPERNNGPLEGWLIERRVAGTTEVSTVGHLPPTPPPLSLLDSSSALSPWTSYQYRLVVSTQAGSATGPWVNITTRPSRPAGLSPPRVTVLGPESLQVTWSPPLIPNGEIHGYEVRLPVPRVSYVNGNGSELNVTVMGLVPYTNYSVTILACSKGGGHIGGCTESLPTPVTTLPTVPQSLAPLAVVTISESFLAISWQPPNRPNGPNIRYELLRRKTHQPLATATVPTETAPPIPPVEDLHHWLHVYSGTKLFYQDKGLSRFTWYQYQLLVHNDEGYSSGEIVTAVTMAGVPLHPPSLSALAINHTAVQLNWTQPSLQDLQGEVEFYFLMIDSAHISQNLTFPIGVISTVISDLWPSTTYRVSLQVSNGAHNTTRAVVNVTTKDGEPEGVSAPEVVPVNSSVVRVLWSPPLRPNGAVTGYRIFLNNHLHGNVDNSSGSYLLGQLLPFTVYNIQLEVCTVYACVRSNVTQTTTVEDLPSDLAIPHTQVLGPRAVRLEWSSPGRPSGIMLGYEVLRRTLKSCGGGSAGVTTPLREESGGGGGGKVRCSYLECPTTHGVCGASCFQPDVQVCCDGVSYTRKPHHQCCEGHYLSLSNSSHSVCCGGKLLPPLPDHQCCGRYYVPVETSEHCCPDLSQGRVSVGLGDSCCGGVPYSMKWGQLCCGGSLHDGYGVQCCGGQVVDNTLVCCGEAERGRVHTPTPGFVCCSQEYINSSTSLCCVGPDGYPTMHLAGNATVTLQCCGSTVIHQEEECCNGIGYDPQRHVCADQPTPGLLTQPKCLQGAVCPIAAASTAYCGSCDIDPSMTACTWVLHTHASATTYSPSMTTTHGSETTDLHAHTHRSDDTHAVASTLSHTHSQDLWFDGSLCPSHEEVVYSGYATRYTYTDSDLEPFTTYEYRVRGWNSFGRGSSNVTTVTTNEDTPWGVVPPSWSRLGDRDDIIQLHWQAPARPNGKITHYIILRDGQERYRGDENSFADVGGIKPFQEYSYQLRACNRAGCADSAQVVAVTVQGVPEGVQSPVITALSPSSLCLNWSEPSRANGIVQRYHLNQTGIGTIYTHNNGPRNYTVTGLQPYRDYSFVLVACTVVGCGASLPSTGRTLQASPAGVWSRPRHLIINTTAVDLYWDQPFRPNGQIVWYRLIRDGGIVFTGDHRDQNYTDAGLLPNHRYVYELEARTRGGSSLSGRYVVQTPVSCPTGILPPHNVTVLGPHSIFLAWTPPARFNRRQPVSYNVLLNPGSDRAMVRPAGRDLHLTMMNLEPFTTYYIRVQACQIEGCGVGEGVYARTLEAPPEGLHPPTVKAAGAKVLEVHWSPPDKPNGLIISYFIYRRPVGTNEGLLVFIWSNGLLEFIDASNALQPFSQYQYRVRAQNSKGSVLSQWASARTLEAAPEDMAPPIATPTSAYSVHLKWSEPLHPNGLISHYRLVYKKHQQDPTLNSSAVTALTVEGSVLEATLYGLEPYSEYSLRVEAVNGAGSVFSPWVGTRTMEDSPAGLANFTVEQREQSRALLLSWDQPHTPNGVITMYNLYSEGNLEFSGLSRHFLFRRLEPWTIYTLALEACTSAGCTRTPPQHVTTAAAPPTAQPPPRPLSIGPDRISLAWGPPSQPNGPIAEYFLLGRSLEEGGRGRSNEDDIKRGKVLFREAPPQEADSFSYTVTGLRPWTQYQFSVRAHNPAGHTLSPWITVTTRQGPPRGLALPTVNHLQGRPSELLVSWTPPLETNGVLLSYRIERNNVSFSFSFDPSVLSYTDEDLLPFSEYSYAVIACTSEGCLTSPHTNITTLEAPPATVEAPAVGITTSHSTNVSWSAPLTQNGAVTEYVLKLNNEEAYRGRGLYTVLSDLRPHTSYQLVLLACTSGGCTPSTTISTVTEEAPPTGLPAPTLKVTGPESVEISWTAPEHPNGIITGYELRRDGEVIYVGTETRYHDFTLLPSVEYSYFVRANNSRGVVSSTAATARTHPSAPSGVGPPTMQPVGPSQVRVEWSTPARPNGEIVNYTVYQRDPVQLRTTSTVFTPEHSAFSDQHITLQGLAPYHRYEVRVEACTALGCSSSDWSSILTLEAPPAGQTAPLLDLQPDAHTDLQTTFLLTWSPPARPNGRVLHYEVYRRLGRTTDTRAAVAVTLVCRNVSTSCRDEGLQPYTMYQYQVWSVNSAGRSASPWANGRTGPAPPEGVGPPTFLRILATSVVVDIRPPARPNGIVSLYRVFSLDHSKHTLLSEGTFHQQTLHGLTPYTQYWVGVEACTCYQCCSQGPLSELRTLAAPPAHQPPPRPLTLTSRSAQLEWVEPLTPNGVIESCELHVRSSCPQPPQPVPLPCAEGPIETCFSGKAWSYNVTGLQPYTNYELRAACFNNMGSTASNWTTVTTLTEAPQYVSPFSVSSNLTLVWLDWGASFSLNGPLKEYSVTESRLRVYTGFHSYHHVPLTSQKTLLFQVTCTTDSGSASTPTIRYSPATGLGPVEPTEAGKLAQGPVYYELWFILLLALLGLFLLTLCLGLVLHRALKKNPSARERPPLVTLQKTRHAGGEAYTTPSPELCSKHHSGSVRLLDRPTGLTDTKIISSSSRFSPMSVLRVPSQTDLSHSYSQHSLHRSISQLIDMKSLMEEGSWDNPLGHDSGLYVEDDEFVDAIKAFSSVRKEHTMFIDTHL